MRFRWITLLAVCAVMAWGGYQTSVLRAGAAPFSEILAAAGSEPGFFGSNDLNDESDDYRISALSVFSNVAIHVKDNYVDPIRISPKEMLVAALQQVERQIAEVLVEELGDGRVAIRVLDHEKVIFVDDVETLWEINLKLREVFQFLEKNLPPQKDMRAIEYAAVNGALSTLDPHSVLLKPEAFAEMKTSTKGEFGGLGIVISVRDGKLTIISPLSGTPASRAGLKAMDVISRIGDVSTVSMPIEEAVRMLRGPEGSKVTIWVERKGWSDARKFVITRERIKIESVESELLSQNVGYIRVKNFQQNTGKDLEDHMAKLTTQAGGKLHGLVLDFRNNPGGLLEQAIRVSDKFLTSGDIVTTVGYGNKLREPKRARWSGTESELPLAVLVNKGSASASEIVAGALKNLDRAVVLGERTFGKGSVQVLYDFADNSALKLTIAQYLTPGAISIQNVGVTPDIELTPAWVEDNGVRLYFRPEGHREKNLNKHLDRAGAHTIEAEQPKHSVTYLIERQDDDDAENAEPEPEKFEEDRQIRMAKELLLEVGAPSRAKMLGKLVPFIRKQRKTEEQRIMERMKKLGVDWRPNTSKGLATVDKPKLDVELKLSPTSDLSIEAGTEVEMTAVVTNASKQPLYRLHGILESEHLAFKGREFLFGFLKPGASKSWKITTKIPKEAASRSDLVTLSLSDESDKVLQESVIPVVTKYVPHPQFAYSYLINDSKRGDGDGVLEAGEGVEFVVLVTNTGPGDADEVTLRLKSGAKENLFLERGRVRLGKLGSGETKAGHLKFRVRRNQTRDDLPLELTIFDSGTGEWLEDEFALDASSPKNDRVRPIKRGLTAKRDTRLYAAAREDNQVLALVPKGTRFFADGRLRDLYRVRLDDKTTGWVPAAATRRAPRSKKLPIDKLAFQAKRRPPTIKITENVGGRVVDDEQVRLAGVVTGRELRDMYVLLNDKKVFFKSGPTKVLKRAKAKAPPKQWTAVDENAVKLPFKVDLKLKDGLNKVLVVARLDERVMSFRALFVSRRSSPPSAVAEATNNNEPLKRRKRQQ